MLIFVSSDLVTLNLIAQACILCSSQALSEIEGPRIGRGGCLIGNCGVTRRRKIGCWRPCVKGTAELSVSFGSKVKNA